MTSVPTLDANSIFGESNKSKVTLQSSVDELLKSISSVESAAGEYSAAKDKESKKPEAHAQKIQVLSQQEESKKAPEVKQDVKPE